MAHIHLNSSSNGGRVNLHDPTTPKYVGARAEVTRTEEGVRIWLKDYQGETEEIIAEAIESITTNADGSLTFTLPDERTITTDSLRGPQGVPGEQGPPGDPGETGDPGEEGVGIASITKTGTSGLVDTYTITYTDGDTSSFTITNGKDGVDGVDGVDGEDGMGIASISKTSTSGLVDTYTITYTDGTTSTFTVTNGQDGADGSDGIDGQDGQNGQDGQDGADGFSPTATVVKVGDTATITITDKNGTTTASISDGSSAGAEEIFLATYGSTSYADMLDAYQDGKILFVRNGSRYVPLYNVGEISGSYVFNFYSLGGDTSTTRYYLTTDGWGTATSAEFVTVNRKVNNKPLSSDITLTATDVGALPSSTSIPSKVSDLTNDSGYLTLATLPIYNGGVS